MILIIMKNFLIKIGLLEKPLSLGDLAGDDVSSHSDLNVAGDPEFSPQPPNEDARKSSRLSAVSVAFRKNLSLRSYLTTVVFLAVTVASGVAGVSAYNMQYQKALSDTWAIMFLEGEKFGLDL